MKTSIKRGIVSGALALSLLGGSAAGVVAQNQGNQGQQGGAAGLIAAVVQVQLDDTVNVEVVDSFNDLRVLNNFLNNSPILSNNDVDVTVGDVSILNDFLNDNNITLENFLNDLDLVVGDVVGIALLSNGDIIVLT